MTENKDLKILEVVDSYYPNVDGAINAVKNYTKELNRISTAKLACPMANKKLKYVDNEEFEVIRCNSLTAPEDYRLAEPSIDKNFSKKLKSENFDIIHVHTPFTLGRYMVKFAKRNKIPVVATLHTQYHQDFERVLKGFKPLVKFMIKFISKVYNNADSVWTVSNASCNFLRQYGYKGNIEVIRNGTDYVYPENFQELIEEVNKKHDLYGQKNVFCFVGRMAMYKNLKLICDSLKILKDKGVDYKMLFVGGGFDYEELVEYATNLGILDKCIFTGNVSDRKKLQGYYLRSDLLLFPSTFDMASVSGIEAACHKLPALMIKGACTSEMIEDNVSGFLAKEEANDYANRIIEIIKEPEFMKKVGENAYKMIYRTWEDVAKEVKEKYIEIIKEHKNK